VIPEGHDVSAQDDIALHHSLHITSTHETSLVHVSESLFMLGTWVHLNHCRSTPNAKLESNGVT